MYEVDKEQEVNIEQLIERATRDALSGLLNRDSLTKHITERLNEMRAKDACVMLMVDLDDFKQVNDQLGHQTGDQMIQQTARVLSRFFRAKDVVGRLGGDEFIAFMQSSHPEDAICQKATALCEALQFTVGTSPCLQLSASIGICVAFGEGLTFDEIYSQADKALYQAKDNGKGCYQIRKYNKRKGDRRIKEPEAVVNTIQLRTLLEYMDGGVELLEIGPEISLIYVSPSYSRLMGVDLAQYELPRPLSQIQVHPDDIVEYTRLLREGAESGVAVDHVHRSSADGENWHWLHVRAIRVSYADSEYPVMLTVVTDISELKHQSDLLRTSNERLRIAFGQTETILWEVDIATRVFGIYDITTHSYEPGTVMPNFPESLIAAGWVHPKSVEQFRTEAMALLSGREEGGGALILKYHSSQCYGWTSVSYHTLFSEDGLPEKVIGISQELPNIEGEQANFAQESRLLEALRPNLVMSYSANLSANMITDLWALGRSTLSAADKRTYTDAFTEEAEALYTKEDRESFLAAFNLDALLEAFVKGRFWVSAEYQRVDPGGTIRWASYVVNLVCNPVTRDICAFGFIRDIEHRHRWETLLDRPIKRDSVTRLYTRETTQELAEKIIQQDSMSAMGMVLVKICGLQKLQASGGEHIERCRYFISTVLSSLLDVDCIVGQQSDDMLLIFCKKADSESQLRQRIEQMIALMRNALSEVSAIDHMRFISGVVFELAGHADFNTMLAQASYICEKWSDAAVDTVAAIDAYDRIEQQKLSSIGEGESLITNVKETIRPLTGEEKLAMFDCLASLLHAKNYAASMDSILSCIGSYYWADRVYTLTRTEANQVVTAAHEWTHAGKRSLKSSISGLSFDRFPLLKRSLETNEPVTVTRNAPAEADSNENGIHNTWNYIVLPITDEHESIGFLCIDNPKRHGVEISFCSALLSYIISERKRFAAKDDEHLRLKDELTRAWNLRAYTDMVRAYTPNAYTSAGALAVNVTNIADINRDRGYEYGSKLLLFIADTLGTVFSQSNVFRIRGAEFVVICTNTVRRVFVDRCERVKKMLEARYPRLCRIGYAWANQNFSGSKLVRDAVSIMRCGVVDGGGDAQMFHLGAEAYASVNDAIGRGRFTIYLQPKLDMRTGKLEGAEALARGLDETGIVIPPSDFIEMMERSGIIRDLDYFVLNRTLSLMENWQQLTTGKLTVSINLSKYTLMDASALASVLAIHSRYPSVPATSVEFEVSEASGDFESEAIANVIEQFRPHGYRFALDDFGAKYSNLSVISDIKFDTIKLDRGLIQNIGSNAVSYSLVEHIAQVCQDSGVLCIAEGVETPEQIVSLLKAGCMTAQGFYYDKPLPIDQFEEKYLLGDMKE